MFGRTLRNEPFIPNFIPHRGDGYGGYYVAKLLKELPVPVAAFYGFRCGEVLGLLGLSYGRLP